MGNRPRATQQAEERRRRQKRIEEMMLRGLTNRDQMAAAFGVNVNTIVKDIKLIKEGWLQTDGENAREKALLRVRQIENIAHLALESYRRSRKDEEEFTTVEKNCDNPGCTWGILKTDQGNKQCPKCQGEGRVTIETKKVKGQAGDASFLTVAKACFVECARIELQPNHLSGLRTTVEQTIGADGEIYQKVEQLYMDAPYEQVTQLRAMLEDLRYRQKTGYYDNVPGKTEEGTIETTRTGEDGSSTSVDETGSGT